MCQEAKDIQMTHDKNAAKKASPDALALAAEWWRVEEMEKAKCKVMLTVGDLYVVTWMTNPGIVGQVVNCTPAAAIIAAHEAWKKEYGK